ncbi:uncharacterized protein LOC143222529 isoform X2 [Tachypleus tridentatus]|uniref:uncharacterized protein LOC143222529 isoform X2 n=1 Tax=Tachypleus tridentatus TaxID=6853 RepID=UPI003FD2C8FF
MTQSDEAGKLFIGGLSWDTSQENLKNYFSRFGEVVDCVVMKNNETGRSRGFGFVTFKDPDCVSIVLASGPHELDGRVIDPKASNPRGLNRPKKGVNYPKVFLGGLPSTCTETTLREHFSKYGQVMEVVIMFDQERKKSRGFGFLSFEKQEIVHRVCADHYVTINGKQVECKMAEPREMSKSAKDSKPGNQDVSPWGGPNGWAQSSTVGGSGGSAGGPGIGPNGPPAPIAPNMGAMGNMGPMANGMMAGGWGGPPQSGAYGPQGGWGMVPGGYGGYQGWGGAPSGFGPYGPPGPQYGQQGYGGFGVGAPGFGGFGATMPVPGGPVAGQTPAQMYGQAGVNAPTPSSGAIAPPGTSEATAVPKAGAMANYAQEVSNFGPARGFIGTGGFGTGMTGNFSGQGDGSVAAAGGVTRTAGVAQGYHPYRR